MSRSDDRVELSRSGYRLLLLACLSSWLALAFLLGRLTATPALVVATPQMATPRVAAVAEPGVPAEIPVATLTPEPSLPTATPTPTPKALPPSPEALQVRAYLDRVESITAGTQDLGDPNEFASNLLNQSLLGDTSQLDGLVTQSQHCLDQLKALEPPPRCKSHRQLAIAQVQSSLKLLKGLRQALQTSDSEALMSLAAQGRQMQSQVAHLERMSQELRQIP